VRAANCAGSGGGVDCGLGKSEGDTVEDVDASEEGTLEDEDASEGDMGGMEGGSYQAARFMVI